MSYRVFAGCFTVALSVVGWALLRPSGPEVPARTTLLRVSLDQEHALCLPSLDTRRSLPEYDCEAGHLQRRARPTRTRGGATFADPHADGVSDLVYSPKYPDLLAHAVRKLEDAIYVVEADPVATAQRFNDLAAAYFQRALQRDAPLDLLRSLDALEQAHGLDPDSAYIHFNRATVLQLLNLRHRAVEAWQRYLQLDTAAPWADEAREMLEVAQLDPYEAWSSQAVEAAIDAGDVQSLDMLLAGYEGRARELVDLWLQDWAGNQLDGKEALAVEALRRAEVLAQWVAAANGDTWAGDVVRIVQEAEGATASALAEAHRLYQEALPLLTRDSAAALAGLRAARDRFQAAGHPGALRAQLYIDLGVHFFDEENKNLPALRAAYQQLRARCAPAYLHFLVELDLLEALAHMQEFQLAAARALLVPALEEAVRLGEFGLERQGRAYLAELQDWLGDPEAAWTTRFANLTFLDRYRPEGVHEVLAEAAFSLARAEMPHAALQFLEEAEARLDLTQRDDLQILPLLRRAQLSAQLARFAAAEGSLHRGRAYLDAVGPELRPRYEAEIGMLEALLHREEDPEAALRALDRVIEAFEGTNRILQLEAQLARGDLLARQGAPLAAVQDLQAALDTYRELRASDELDSWTRLRFFEQSRAGFESLILCYLQLEDPAAALEVSEQLRARVLLDQTLGSLQGLDPESARAQPLSSSDILARQPAGVTVLSTLVLPDRLVVLRLQEGRVTVSDFTEPWLRGRDFRTGLRLAVQAQHPSSGKSPAEVTEAARYVARALGVDSTTLPLDGSLVVIPDHSLHQQPFAALYLSDGSETGDELLVQRHSVGVALSLSLLLQSPSGTPSRWQRLVAESEVGESVSALIVGNPAMAESLEAAEEEARQIAALYPNSTLLLGPQATRDAVLGALATSPRVVHLATHGFSNIHQPQQAYLQLAEQGDAEDRLSAADLYSLQLPTTDLVVLAACDTGVGDFDSVEGPLHLARPFVASGVPYVVATLWKVDDEVAQRVMVEFHRELRRGIEPRQALRAAQRVALAQLVDADDKADVAAIVLIESGS